MKNQMCSPTDRLATTHPAPCKSQVVVSVWGIKQGNFIICQMPWTGDPTDRKELQASFIWNQEGHYNVSDTHFYIVAIYINRLCDYVANFSFFRVLHLHLKACTRAHKCGIVPTKEIIIVSLYSLHSRFLTNGI